MAALPTIETRHVRAALADVRRDGVPAGRGSTKFCLISSRAHYPPKYVVALAARHAAGRELRPGDFSGGAQTNAVLENLGFTVAACRCGGHGGESSRARSPTSKPTGSMWIAGTRRVRGPFREDVAVARIVTRGQMPENTRAPERILLEGFGALWPSGVHAKFTVTPGGLVNGAWPASWRGRSGWESRKADIEPLFLEAERQLADVVTDRVYRAAAGKTDVLTVGIDLNGDDVNELAELVAVFDIARRSIVRWTGKSYPTPGQQHRLVHVVDLGSHLLETAGERVLILGCHDLNLFSPRARANQSPDGVRRARCDAMDRKVGRFKPTVVLQHPHSTDTPNIWRMPWLSLERAMPSVRVWASGIGYHNFGSRPRAKLDRVLALTKNSPEDVRDIVVDVKRFA